MTTYYRQCWLGREKQKCIHVAWIPEKYAKFGKVLKIKDVDGYKVLAVGSVRKPEAEVNERSRDFKQTRKASDI